jgi:hypothetical protein
VRSPGAPWPAYYPVAGFGVGGERDRALEVSREYPVIDVFSAQGAMRVD